MKMKPKKTACDRLWNHSNPAALKFVVSKMLTKNSIEFKNIDQTGASPLAKEHFRCKRNFH
jgi:hypothetical protein